MKLRIRNFDGGLALTPGEDKIPDNALVRARGIDRLTRGAVFSRQGSTALHVVSSGISLGVAGISYWNSKWFYGTSNSLYCGSTCISSGTYTGSRLTILPAAPTAGMPEVLFIAGGSTLSLRKVNTTETVSNWGITPPADTIMCSGGGTTGWMTTASAYMYRHTYYNANTGTRSNPTPVPSSLGYSTNTKLLLYFDGADASTGITDSSPAGRAFAAIGTAALSTADPKAGSACLYCDGSTDGYIWTADTPDWYFGSNPFTIDFWIKILTRPVTLYTGIFAQKKDSYDYSWEMAYTSTMISFAAKTGGATVISLDSTFTYTTGTWYHIAAIRGWGGDRDRFAITVDGALLKSATVSVGAVLQDCSATVEIGRWKNDAGAGIAMHGYLDTFRITKGEALWTDPFTPSTAYPGTAYLVTSSVSKAAQLSFITPSTEAQVTHTELWRTAAGGSAFYLVTRLGASETAYLDQTADADLGIEELPTDNLKPYPWFDDCIVYNASMFWITRTQTGELGRLYYSPIGRLEAVQGYINITDDSDPLQRLVLYGTAIGVFSKSGFFEIQGTNPYFHRQVHGVPGTLEPYSVCVTPYGIAYEAPDGPRLLVGAQTTPLAEAKLDAIFQGEARSQLVAWSTGTYGAYAHEEYILSNTGSSQTLAVNLRTGRWRDLGIGFGAMHYAPTADILGAHCFVNPAVTLNFEQDGSSDDIGAAIAFSIETKHYSDSGAQRILVRGVHVDAKTGSTSLAATLVYDSTTLALASVSATSRTVTELPCGKWVREFGVRLGNSLTNQVEVYGIDIDVYAPQEVSE